MTLWKVIHTALVESQWEDWRQIDTSYFKRSSSNSKLLNLSWFSSGSRGPSSTTGWFSRTSLQAAWRYDKSNLRIWDTTDGDGMFSSNVVYLWLDDIFGGLLYWWRGFRRLELPSICWLVGYCRDRRYLLLVVESRPFQLRKSNRLIAAAPDVT